MKRIQRPSGETWGNQSRYAGSLVTCSGLAPSETRARQILRFMRQPVWRGYTTTYVEGAELVGAWWARDPGPERLRRLLDEPLTPRALRAELAS